MFYSHSHISELSYFHMSDFLVFVPLGKILWESTFVYGAMQAYVSTLSLFISSFVHLIICLSVYLSISLSVYLYIYLSVYLSICLSVYLSICLYVYPSHHNKSTVNHILPSVVPITTIQTIIFYNPGTR